MPARFRTLRFRLALPLLSVAIVAAALVAVVSYWLGDRWARGQIEKRYEGISRTLTSASFPLNRRVVELLADLTRTELITVDRGGLPIHSSLPLQRPVSAELQQALQSPPGVVPSRRIELDGRLYRIATFSRRPVASGTDRADRVAVLFDEQELAPTRLSAATLPLITGLSTIVLLASVTYYLASRLVTRVARLQREVNQIAAGNFDTAIGVGTDDEIGGLAAAIREMSSQLKRMWQSLHRQEGQKLLHQIAGGLAHQLRNSITVRMAVELHEHQCDRRDDESLKVALTQLEQTDDYVRRLMLVAAGKQDQDRPGSATECLADLRRNLATTAKHRNVNLRWKIDDGLAERHVADTPSLAAAVSNLVLNAMQEAKQVEVRVEPSGTKAIRIDVIDDGPGPAAEIADELFEPFVTSKPEGLGLGLPLVRRSATRLGGEVRWFREECQTHFVLTVATQ